MKRFAFVFALLLCLPSFTQAAAPAVEATVYISEIAWAGSTASTSDEWIELCGAAGTDLSNWTIEGASTNALTLPVGSVIPESGAFLISNYGNEDAKSTLLAPTQYTTTSIALSNTQLFLSLRDPNTILIDSAGASGTPPFVGTSGSVKTSMLRLLPLQIGSLVEAWTSASVSNGFDAGSTELGTPGSCPKSTDAPVHTTVPDEPAPIETIEATPAPSSTIQLLPTTAVRISEIYPSPRSGEQEWVELVNPSGIGEVLTGWTIEDGKGVATALTGVLLPWQRLVILAPKGSLNNAGDLVVLKDAQSRMIDGLAYGDWETALYPRVGDVTKGEAAIRLEFQEVFDVTTLPTPNAANVLVRNIPDAANASPTPVSAPPSVSTPPSPSAQPSPSTPAEAGVQRSTPPPIPPVILSAAKDLSPERDSSVASRSQNDKRPTALAKPKTATSRYKGVAYSAVIAVPPGVYSKTRMYVLHGNDVREMRLSKSTTAAYTSGQKISFVAQTKEDGGAAFLLANPNSIKRLGEAASNTFANIEQWPTIGGSYRFIAELTSLRTDGAEVRLNGIEGDVLLPKAIGALKPGDRVEIQGFVSPGARPRVVIPGIEFFRLYEAAPAQLANHDLPRTRLPWFYTAALTATAGGAGLAGYLRSERLKRLALLTQPIEEDLA